MFQCGRVCAMAMKHREHGKRMGLESTNGRDLVEAALPKLPELDVSKVTHVLHDSVHLM